MTAIGQFIRNILNQHAVNGCEHINTGTRQDGAQVDVVVIVLPHFVQDEHPLYEYGLSTCINGRSNHSIRHGGMRGGFYGSFEHLTKYKEYLQRFIDALRNEQSVVELAIQDLPPSELE